MTSEFGNYPALWLFHTLRWPPDNSVIDPRKHPMSDPPDPPEMNLRSMHFLLYRSENAFGKTLSLAHSGHPALLLHQPYNAWSVKHWDEPPHIGDSSPSHRQSNEQMLMLMLEKAYQQGRESLRDELTTLLGISNLR